MLGRHSTHLWYVKDGTTTVSCTKNIGTSENVNVNASIVNAKIVASMKCTKVGVVVLVCHPIVIFEISQVRKVNHFPGSTKGLLFFAEH